MPLEDICDKIKNDAQKEADEIKRKSEVELKRLLAEKDEELEDGVLKIKNEAKIKASRLKDQAGFRLRAIEKNSSLEARQKAADAALKEAEKRLLEIGNDEFVRVYSELLKSAPVMKGASVICPAKRRSAAKQALKGAGLDYSLAKEALPEGRDGMILSTKDAEINLTAANIINQVRLNRLGEVMKILFVLFLFLNLS
jgi:vacuolar-type H+-ATPase subunit E/Vma4